MRIAFAMAVPMLMLSACATSEPAKTDANPQVAQARQCERGEATTGSMLTKRICGPALTDDERRRLADEAARIARPTPGGRPMGPGN